MKGFLVVLLSAALLLGSVAPPSPPVASAATATISWKACNPFEPYECGSLIVPLDYALPDGKQITLALKRLPASDQKQRIGSLVMNPGGPGGSGFDFLEDIAPDFPDSLKARFDLVSFDPRGVGQSAPLICPYSAFVGVLFPEAASDELWDRAFKSAKEFADRCGVAGKNIIDYMGTRNVARDLDRIRDALGDDKLTYLGYSYGTEIGAVYAEMFPSRARALVLDGAVDLSLPVDQILLEQALGFELTFRNYLADCKAKSCLLTKRGDPTQVVDGLLRQATLNPITAKSDGSRATVGTILDAISSAMYNPRAWTRLTNALDAAIDGDPTDLLDLLDKLGTRRTSSSGNSQEAFHAVDCVDGFYDKEPSHYKHFAYQLAANAPHFGASQALSAVVCSYWPAKPDPLRPARGRGTAPILVIGSTGDPATPYKWAINLANQLESGRLLTREGDGHTGFLMDNSCVDAAVTEYFLNLKLPARDTRCKPDPTPKANFGNIRR